MSTAQFNAIWVYQRTAYIRKITVSEFWIQFIKIYSWSGNEFIQGWFSILEILLSKTNLPPAKNQCT